MARSLAFDFAQAERGRVIALGDLAIEVVGQVVPRRGRDLRAVEVAHPLVADPPEFGEHRLALGVDQLERVDAVAVHRPIA